MSTSTSFVTADELLRYPRGKARHELIKGEIQTMSPAGSEHGAVTFQLSTLIGNHVAATRAGRAFGAETGFLIQRDPDTVRAPDIAFIRRERLPSDGLPQGFWPGAPDLAVEVVSPGDTVREIDEKVSDWLAAGCLVVWIVSPRWKTVTVHAAGSPIKMLAADNFLEGDDVLPGFRCAVSEIFDGL